ncbi:MAG TPA: hypothetical protein VLQ91_18990, partial [Draconibacterium sp.]|nr:hypothetical protein [Draconibacterium sp.]
MKRRKFLEDSLLITPPVLAFPEILFAGTNQNLANVLIIGDSISIGYTPFVREILKYRANVYRPVLDDGNP